MQMALGFSATENTEKQPGDFGTLHLISYAEHGKLSDLTKTNGYLLSIRQYLIRCAYYFVQFINWHSLTVLQCKDSI